MTQVVGGDQVKKERPATARFSHGEFYAFHIGSELCCMASKKKLLSKVRAYHFYAISAEKTAAKSRKKQLIVPP